MISKTLKEQKQELKGKIDAINSLFQELESCKEELPSRYHFILSNKKPKLNNFMLLMTLKNS